MYRHTGATHLAKGGGSFIYGTHQDDIRLLVFAWRVRGCIFELLLIFGEGWRCRLRVWKRFWFYEGHLSYIKIPYVIWHSIYAHIHSTFPSHGGFHPHGFFTWDVWDGRPSLEKSGRWHRRWHPPFFVWEGLVQVALIQWGHFSKYCWWKKSCTSYKIGRSSHYPRWCRISSIHSMVNFPKEKWREPVFVGIGSALIGLWEHVFQSLPSWEYHHQSFIHFFVNQPTKTTNQKYERKQKTSATSTW